MADILQPMEPMNNDTDLGALFCRNDAMLGYGDDAMADVAFDSWQAESHSLAGQQQQWSSWGPAPPLFDESVKPEPVDSDMTLTSPLSTAPSSPPSSDEPQRPSIDQLEATVRAQSSRSRESGLKHLAVAEEDIPDSLDALSDQQLAMVDFKILMHLMEKAGLNKEQIAEVKARRRRLKNRLSARLCSNKKREKCSELEETNRDLLTTLRELSVENQTLKTDSLRLQEANASLTKASFETSRENALLRAQVAHLTQLLATAGIVPDEEGAAFAA
eukprot:TRINITY_DN12531_c3_g1_i1.p1 TRINITY_DN12531_c3_g1~~TRINITY_DN12531_c3_g1_i1.p1  ORF type:complete len:310 (+),score=69.87 TRINITY_DN12531_c3_g1_i1:109-930(+)